MVKKTKSVHIDADLVNKLKMIAAKEQRTIRSIIEKALLGVVK